MLSQWKPWASFKTNGLASQCNGRGNQATREIGEVIAFSAF